MKVAITGGAGYIGMETARQLIKAGHVPVIIDHQFNGDEDLCECIEIYINGTTNHLNGALKGCDAVIHLAALKDANQSIRVPMEYYWNNITATMAVIDAMYMNGISKIIYSSTCAIYGDMKLVTDITLPDPLTPYAKSKYWCEHIIQDARLDHIILRYFNVAGGDQTVGLMAELKKDNFKIYGDKWHTRDGTCVRDYIHVTDVAMAHIKALEVEGNHTLNIGTGTGYSVMDVVHAYELKHGPIKREVVSPRDGDIAVIVNRSAHAWKVLDWTPTKTIDDMI